MWKYIIPYANILDCIKKTKIFLFLKLGQQMC